MSSNISSSNNVSVGGEAEGGYSECWSVEKLRAYIQHIQTAYQPTITHEASQLLVSKLNVEYLLLIYIITYSSHCVLMCILIYVYMIFVCTKMAYYSALRQSESNTSRATVRLLESLVRLSQAHARLCCQHQVLLYDAVVAIYCVSLSNTESATLGMSYTIYYILSIYACINTCMHTYMRLYF